MRTLFVGRGTSRTAWYRVVLPAMHLGQDWAGFSGDPPNVLVMASCVERQTLRPNLDDYDVIVFQQVKGQAWINTIRKLRAAGKTVLFECDDDLHSVRKAADHEFRGSFDKQTLKEFTACMKACDGMIVSTDALAERYERYARFGRIWVCENGLDAKRYELTRPPRGKLHGHETVTIMWSGGTGHALAAEPWLGPVADVMRRNPHTCFASIGQTFAGVFAKDFPGRSISVPFCALESYPAAMMLGDLAIAPAGRTDWYTAKSQLRAMEAAALGLPIVADKHYAPSVREGETGFVVSSPIQARARIERLIRDDELRRRMGAAAKQHARDEFWMEHRVGAWATALEEAHCQAHTLTASTSTR